MSDKFTHFIKLSGFVLFAVFTQVRSSLAQQYPIQVQANISSPASVKLSEYYTGINPALMVLLTNRDLSQNAKVYLKFKIVGPNGFSLTTRDDIRRYTTGIELLSGIPKKLSSQDLQIYFSSTNINVTGGVGQSIFNKGGTLPSGNYTFRIEVYNYLDNSLVNNPDQSTIFRFLDKPQAPILNSPFNQSEVLYRDANFIAFNWTPQHTGSIFGSNTKYVFELVEVLDRGVDVNTAFQSSRPVFSKELISPSLIYGPSQPLLLPGKRYAWRVQVKAGDFEQDYTSFQNNGYSPIYYFDYNYECPQPDPTFELFPAEGRVAVEWQGVKGLKYNVSWLDKNGVFKVEPSVFAYSDGPIKRTKDYVYINEREIFSRGGIKVEVVCLDNTVKQALNIPKWEIPWFRDTTTCVPSILTNVTITDDFVSDEFKRVRLAWEERSENNEYFLVFEREDVLGSISSSPFFKGNAYQAVLPINSTYKISVGYRCNSTGQLVVGQGQIVDIGEDESTTCSTPEVERLTLLDHGNSILVEWTGNQKISTYEVKCVKTSNPNLVIEPTNIQDNTALFTNLDFETEYSFIVVAKCDKGSPVNSAVHTKETAKEAIRAAEIVESRTIEFKGEVRGSYFDLPQGNAVGEIRTQNEGGTEFSQVRIGNKSYYGIKNYILNLYGLVDSNSTKGAELVETIKTDANGNYSVRVLHKAKYVQYGINTVSSSIYYNDGMLFLDIDTITNEGVETYIANKNLELPLNQVFYHPIVYTPQLKYLGTDSINLAVDILVEKSFWKRHYVQLSDVLNLTDNPVFYNGKEYVSIHTITNSGSLKPLINASYIYRVRPVDAIPTRLTGYAPNSKFYLAETDSNYVKQSLTYFKNNILTGRVTQSASTLPAGDAVVQVAVFKKDIVNDDYQGFVQNTNDYKYTSNTGDTVFIKRVHTSSEGYYSLQLPALSQGSVVEVITKYEGFAENLQSKTIDYSITDYTASCGFTNETYLYTGRVVLENKPVSGALVQVGNKSTRTNTNGFFIMHLNKDVNEKVKIAKPGFIEASFTVNNQIKIPVNPNQTDYAKTVIQTIKSVKCIADNLKGSLKLNQFNFYIEEKNLSNSESAELLARLVNPEYEVKAIKSIEEISLKYEPQTIKIEVSNTSNIPTASAQLSWRHIGSSKQITSQNVTLKKGSSIEVAGMSPGIYDLSIIPRDNEFVPINVEYEVTWGVWPGANQMEIVLKKATLVQFAVKSKSKKLDGATITSDDGQELTTNEDGIATFYVDEKRAGDNLNFVVSKEGFLSKEMRRIKSSFSEQVSLEEAGNVSITSLDGYNVILSKQEASSRSGEFKISGTLLLNGDGPIILDKNKLNFENAIAKVAPANQENGKADLQGVVNFTEQFVTGKLYSTCPVEVEGVFLENGQIQSNKVKLKLDQGDNVHIETKALFSSIKENIWLLADNRTTEGKLKVNYLGTNYSSNVYIEGKDSSTYDEILKLYFENQSTIAEKINVELYSNLSLTIEANKTEITRNRINLPGYFEANNLLGLNPSTPIKANMATLAISNNKGTVSSAFDFNGIANTTVDLQKVKLELEGFYINGLGSHNCVAGVNGKLRLVALQSGKRPSNNVNILTISRLEFNRDANNPTLQGQLTAPSGLSIKGLAFATSKKQYVHLAYVNSEKSFILNTSGTLQNDKSVTNPVAKMVLENPIKMKRFDLQTSTWSVFATAETNNQVDLGVLKVNVDAFALNIASNLDLSKMSSLLAKPISQINGAQGKRTDYLSNGTQPIVAPYAALDVSNSDWTMGIKGSVQFPVKCVNVKSAASLALGNINNKYEFDINELELGIKQQAFTLESTVKLEVNEGSIGFETPAKIEVLNYTTDATLRYYKYSDFYDPYTDNIINGIELGAALNVELGQNEVTTGPITWSELRGGFNCNTTNSIYEVWLAGELTNTGNKKEEMYVEVARLGVLFNTTNQCNYKPVLEGNGTLFIKEKEWSDVRFKADYCRSLLLFSVDGYIPTMPGLSEVNVNSVLFAAAESSKNKGDEFLFLSFNSRMNDYYLINSNVDFSFGSNVNINKAYMPSEVLSLWNTVGKTALDNEGTYFNGSYLSSKISIPEKTGMQDFGLLSGEYRFNANATGEFYRKFSSNTVGLKVTSNATVLARGPLVGMETSNTADRSVLMTGGYSDKWYFNGKADMPLEIVTSSSIQCDEMRYTGTQLGFKVCLRFNVGIQYSEDSPLDVSISL